MDADGVYIRQYPEPVAPEVSVNYRLAAIRTMRDREWVSTGYYLRIVWWVMVNDFG